MMEIEEFPDNRRPSYGKDCTFLHYTDHDPKFLDVCWQYIGTHRCLRRKGHEGVHVAHVHGGIIAIGIETSVD